MCNRRQHLPPLDPGRSRSKSVRVTIIDNPTGASKTVVATAYYEDGWN